MSAGGLLALGGTSLFAAGVVLLHALQPELSPAEVAVSYYVHGRGGVLLTVGLIAWGLGSLALAVELARRVAGPGARISCWLLGVWAAGALLGGVFPADPAGRWDQPPSLAGMIHGNAALVAFVALPLAALGLSRGFARDPRWRPRSALYRSLALAAALSLALFLASLAPVFVRPGPPVLLGLSERLLLVVYAAWLVAVSLGPARRGV